MGGVEKRYRVFTALLRLYPSAYRDRYSQEILQTTADMLSEAPSRSARLTIWLKVGTDLLLNLLEQQVAYAGSAMRSDMPRYVKRNGTIAGILLVPFFAAPLANMLDDVINKRNLYGSWLWYKPVLTIWVLYLPVLALLLAGVSYALYVLKGSDGRSRFKRAFNVVASWPVLVSGAVAFAILFVVSFHDSVHCWVQSPMHLTSHLSQTWQCSEQNSISLPTVLKRAFEL